MSLFIKSVVRSIDVICHLLLCVILYILYRFLIPLSRFNIDAIHYLHPCLQSLKGLLLIIFVHLGFYIGIRRGKRHEYLNACFTVANDDIIDDLAVRLKIERRIFEMIADKHGVDFLANAHAKMAQFVPANSSYITDTFLPPREGCLRRRRYAPIVEPVIEQPPQPPQRNVSSTPGKSAMIPPSSGGTEIDSAPKDAETTKKPPPGVQATPPPTLPTVN